MRVKITKFQYFIKNTNLQIHLNHNKNYKIYKKKSKDPY